MQICIDNALSPADYMYSNCCMLQFPQVLLRSGANSYAKEQHGLDPREFICRCRTYHSDSSLNQCAPGKCLNANDNLAMESFIYQVSDLMDPFQSRMVATVLVHLCWNLAVQFQS